MVKEFENETIEKLIKNGYSIIQKKDGFRFAMDAVLIANFININKVGIVVDFGTGTGIIPLLLSGNERIKKIYGIEIQPDIADMAKRSIAFNELESKIEIMNVDINSIETVFKNDSVDYIITNPPYIKMSDGKKSKNEYKALSRHEVALTLEVMIEKARKILKCGGKFNIIYRINRFQELIAVLSQNRMNISKLRVVHTKYSKPASFVMIEAVKEVKCDIEIMTPLYIFDEEGNNTEEYQSYYEIE